MLQVIPETDSPITHSMSSNDKQGGIQATIFLKRCESFFHYDIFEEDDEEFVYLTSSNTAEFFEPFFLYKNNALVMSLFLLRMQQRLALHKKAYTLADSKHIHSSGTGRFVQHVSSIRNFAKHSRSRRL